MEPGTSTPRTYFRALDGDGLPVESLTASSDGLSLWYCRLGAAKVAITPVDLDGPDDDWAAGGIAHVDDGWYLLCLAAAAVVAGVDEVLVGGTATDCVLISAPIHLEATPPTAAAVADAVWDEATSGHVAAGSFGKLLADLVTAVAALPATTAAIAAAVWSYATRTLTQTSASVAAALDGDTITIRRGDTLTVLITGLGDVSTRTKLWITGKSDRDHPDTSALFKIEETAGLEVINGATATTPANGSITVTDEVAGDMTIVIKGVETAKLSSLSGGAYDVQLLSDDGTDPLTLTDGELHVQLDVTRATS